MAAFALVALTACGAPATSEMQTPGPVEIDFAGPPVDMDAVECGALLTEAEVEEVVGEEVAGTERMASSCYWLGSTRSVQLVFNTRSVHEWRAELLESYTRRLPFEGVEVWAESNSDSFAAFGPGRAVIVHGIASEEDAVALLLLALSRL